MSDESELLARIAAVAGQINQHKQKQQAPPHRPPFPRPSHLPRGSAHWTPYGGRGGLAGIHKNRSLVLSGTHDSTPTHALDGSVTSAGASGPSTPLQSGFVSLRGGHNKQVMSKQTFDRERDQKLAQLAQPRAPQKLPTSPPPTPVVRQSRVLEIAGIKFEMQEDGSKLTRIRDPTTVELETPKKCQVAAVEFLRTKKGNLVRAVIRDGRAVKPTPKPQCANFTKHGKCPFGPSCKFAHNPHKVAICKDFLYKSCPAGANCDLSHKPTYERVPACTHYLRGNCAKTVCLYPHVNVSFDAPVCRPFATVGFCSNGEKCGDRHIVECPDYANTGSCANVGNGKCSLPHIDRAGVLRRAAHRQSKGSLPVESDISSGEDDADAESDGSVDILMGLDDDSHELSQQRDYIAFS